MFIILLVSKQCLILCFVLGLFYVPPWVCSVTSSGAWWLYGKAWPFISLPFLAQPDVLASLGVRSVSVAFRVPSKVGIPEGWMPRPPQLNPVPLPTSN